MDEDNDPIFALIRENVKAERDAKIYDSEPGEGGCIVLKKPDISRRNESDVKRLTTLAAIIAAEPTTVNGHYNKMLYLVEHHEFPEHPGIAKAVFEGAAVIYAAFGEEDDDEQEEAAE
jgi:hypothetical protein